MVFPRDNCSTLISWHADIDSLNFDAFSISLFNKKTRFSILQRNPENYTKKKKMRLYAIFHINSSHVQKMAKHFVLQGKVILFNVL